MGKFFSKFPTVDYNGQVGKNLLVRAKISDNISKNSSSFYNYNVPEESRADIISFDYYGNADYAWLIYMANNVLDPYHDVYLSETDFNLYIIKKYGSLQFANTEIYSWVLSWGIDNREITPVQYEALPGRHKKYWDPVVLNAYANPSSYVRSKDETRLGTNRHAIVNLPGNTLKPGDDYEGLTIDGQTYTARVVYVEGSTVSLQHVIGTASGSTYTGLTDSLVDVSNIAPDELTYWTPISIYDQEVATNAAKRDISLVNKQLAFQVEKDLKRILNQ